MIYDNNNTEDMKWERVVIRRLIIGRSWGFDVQVSVTRPPCKHVYIHDTTLVRQSHDYVCTEVMIEFSQGDGLLPVVYQ